MRYHILILLILLSFGCNSQTLVTNHDKIEIANGELNTTMANFNSCIVNSDLDSCILNLLKNADNEYKKFIIGGILYNIDMDKSYQLHKEAYLSKPEELSFNLEYAIELHRNQEFEEAAMVYEKYSKAKPEDFRVNVWLADCYINTGNIDESIKNWTKANHAKHHTSIDQAINTIYGRSDQLRTRSNYRKEIERRNNDAFYSLIFLDMNWELDWWNTNTQEFLLNEDVRFLETKLERTNVDYITTQTYIKIKNLAKEINAGDSIKLLLINNKMMIGSNPFPNDGQVASDLLRICFINRLISEKEFFNSRGQELLELAKATNDKELLNIYAYLQASVNGKVDASIDKLGWTDFKDERFAISYFIGKAERNRFDDEELAQALNDFPNSSKLYWVKVNCAKIENRELRPHLIELIKREFRTLGSDPSRYSYPLKSYFGYVSSGE
jgi:acyl-CoA-binding protein